MSLELRLLGVPAAIADGRAVTLATRKALALLAYLALEGTTARGQVAELLWSEMPEDAARNNLRKELFRLRETAFKDALEVTGTHLSLSPAVRVDARTFLERAGQGDETALEGYSGALLEGVTLGGSNAFDAWLDAKREQVFQAHQRLLLIKALRLEAGGDWRSALEVRLVLLNADPLQESHHREVMRLHARLGERGAALETFDRLANILERELGLKPLPETLELLSSIQRGALPDVDEPAPSSDAVPNLSRPPLVGREAAWRWLEERAAGLNLIVGEAGVGKTRLAEDALEGALVLRGFEDSSGTPFAVIADALRTRLDALHALDDVWRLEVARLLPEVLRLGEREALVSGDGRARFIESLTRALLCALGPQGTALLDDLHWFDASSVEVVTGLVRRAPQARFVATARQLELSEFDALQKTLNALERDGLLHQLHLEPFNPTQTLSLLQSLSGGSARLFARRLHDATGGNALYTLETLRGLFQAGALHTDERGAWITAFDDATEDYTELPLPPNVLELALRRVTHLGGAVQRFLEVAALAGEPFEADDLDGATALSEWEGLEALERALSAQVIKPEGSAYRFSHDLLRRSVLGAQSPERQRLIHRRLAQTLVKNRAAPARIAQHLDAGARAQDAAPWHIKAAQAAQGLYAHSEARTHYQRALEHTPDERQAYAIHAALADLELTLLNLEAMDAHARTMLELAARLNDPALETQARLTRIKVQLYRGQYKEALHDAEETLPNANGDALPEALTVLGTALIGCGRLSDAEPHLRRALETAQARSPLIGEAHALLKEIYRQQGDLERALEHAEAARASHQTAGRVEQELTMQAHAGQLLGGLGRSGQAQTTLREALAQARALGFERVLTVCLLLLTEELSRSSDWGGMEGLIREGIALTHGKMPVREAQFSGMLARVQMRTNRLHEAFETAETVVALCHKLGLTLQEAEAHIFLTEIALGLEQPVRAREHLELAEQATAHLKSQALSVPIQIFKALLSLADGDLGQARAYLEPLGVADNVRHPHYKQLLIEAQQKLNPVSGLARGTDLERSAS
jgi:DNA-binding SARP family transcriptional activator